MDAPIESVRVAAQRCRHAPDDCPVLSMMSGSAEALRRGLLPQVFEACRTARHISLHCVPGRCPARPEVERLLAELEDGLAVWQPSEKIPARG